MSQREREEPLLSSDEIEGMAGITGESRGSSVCTSVNCTHYTLHNRLYIDTHTDHGAFISQRITVVMTLFVRATGLVNEKLEL